MLHMLVLAHSAPPRSVLCTAPSVPPPMSPLHRVPPRRLARPRAPLHGTASLPSAPPRRPLRPLPSALCAAKKWQRLCQDSASAESAVASCAPGPGRYRRARRVIASMRNARNRHAACAYCPDRAARLIAPQKPIKRTEKFIDAFFAIAVDLSALCARRPPIADS